MEESCNEPKDSPVAVVQLGGRCEKAPMPASVGPLDARTAFLKRSEVTGVRSSPSESSRVGTAVAAIESRSGSRPLPCPSPGRAARPQEHKDQAPTEITGSQHSAPACSASDSAP